MKYHIDIEYEGRRLCDNVEGPIGDIDRARMMVYSPLLRANIIISKKELKRL